MPVEIAGNATLRQPSSAASSSERRWHEASSSSSPRSPPCQTGPTVWMTCRAGNRPAPVAFASPVSQPPSRRHSASSSGPAARWIAPSTPPPPSRLEFAAFTIASTDCSVMSPRTASICTRRRVGSRIYSTRLQTRWPDFDGLGHLNHAAYHVFLDEARDDVLRRTVGDFSVWLNVVVHASIDYRA